MSATARLRAGWDWAAGYGLIGLGAIAVVVASVGVRESKYVSDQLSLIVSGGLGGLLLLGAGAALVITAGLTDEWRKLDRVAELLPGSEPGPDAAALARQTRLCACVGVVMAGALLLSAWSNASNEADPEPGFEAVGLGSFGLVVGFAVCGGSTLWLQRRVARRKAVLFSPWDAVPAATAPSVASLANGRHERVLVAGELKRFHLAGCPVVNGLVTREIDRRQLPAGLEPCELCESN